MSIHLILTILINLCYYPAAMSSATKTLDTSSRAELDSEPDFIVMIRQEFERRTQKNPHYSLRAFSRDLAISPSHLTRVLKGDKKLSLDLARTINERLAWVGPKAHRFLTSVSEQGTDLEKKYQENALNTSRAITPEEFEKIAEWQHLAVLELTEIDGFVLTPLTIARSLGISVSAADSAIRRLEELELLRKHASRGYRKVHAWVHTGGRGRTSAAHRLHQKSLLLKSLENIDRVPMEERANFGSLYAIDPDQIGEAKELINQFIVDLEKLLAGKKRSRVYAAGIFLTPLSGISSSEKNKKESES